MVCVQYMYIYMYMYVCTYVSTVILSVRVYKRFMYCISYYVCICIDRGRYILGVWGRGAQCMQLKHMRMYTLVILQTLYTYIDNTILNCSIECLCLHIVAYSLVPLQVWICPVYDGVQNKPLMLHFLSFNGLSMYRVLHAVGNCDNVINHRPGASIFGVVRRKLSMSIRCRT